jgi:hypothetical protein
MFSANYAPILRQDYHYLQLDGIELPHKPRHLSVPPGLSKTRYVWRKPCTYLALKLTLSPNGQKRDSTWPTSPSNSIQCAQNDIHTPSMLGANRAPILRQDYHYVQMDWIELPHEPRHLGVPPRASKIISEPMVYLAQTVHLSCVMITTIS